MKNNPNIKSLLSAFLMAFAIIVVVSCHKTPKQADPTVNTYKVGGMRNWHHSYRHSVSLDSISSISLPDTSFALTVINSTTVSFDVPMTYLPDTSTTLMEFRSVEQGGTVIAHLLDYWFLTDKAKLEITKNVGAWYFESTVYESY